MKYKYPLLIAGIIVLLSIGISLASVDCPYNNPDKFTSEFEPGSDAYISDSLQFVHPDWSYDKIEDYMFMPESEFHTKYYK